jgi:murein DD-endopeptidase MepM/ murein hydrolase activator NlpD
VKNAVPHALAAAVAAWALISCGGPAPERVGQSSGLTQERGAPPGVSTGSSTRTDASPGASAATSTGEPSAQEEKPARSDSPDYVFPIRPVRVARFGHVHHGYPATDIFAPCGTRVVSPVDGVVVELSRIDRWDPRGDAGGTRGGLFVSIVGDDGVRYYASHLGSLHSGVGRGKRVGAGQPTGRVGRTGSARNTPCHLHFGLSPPCGTGDWAVRRGVVYPWPYLKSWREKGRLSPAPAVRAWLARHGCPKLRAGGKG